MTFQARCLRLLALAAIAIPRISIAMAHDHAETYAIADALFLQRGNAAGTSAAVVDDTTGVTAINIGQAAFTVQPGMRVFFGAIDDCDQGWEAGYLGVWGMFADDAAAGASLRAPDTFALLPNATGFNDRTFATSTYSSTLQSAEFNLVWRSCDGGFSRAAAHPWQRCETYRHGTFDWLLGFRWAGLAEAAELSYEGGGIPVPSTYSVRSNTNLFGVQVGRRGRWEWEDWAVEGWGKVALAGSGMSQSQDPIEDILFPEQPIRSGRSASEGGAGFIGDMSLSLVRRLSDTWGLRAGYNLIWLSGVALAPNQFDFSSTAGSGTDLRAGGRLFLHGASLGLEARW